MNKQIMAPVNTYAESLINMFCGNKAEALKAFLYAVNTDPRFRAASKSWAADVATAIVKA